MLSLYIFLILVSTVFIIGEYGRLQTEWKKEMELMCSISSNILDKINKTRLLPIQLSQQVDVHYRQCQTDKREKAAGGAVLGMFLAVLFAGPIGAAFAGPGLFGAAAVSHGLAVLGGGSLVAGGMGMVGGTLLISTGGLITGATLGSAGDCAMNINGIRDDMYKYENGQILFKGTIEITVKSISFLKGALYRDNGDILYYGSFNNGLPKFCEIYI